jgi:hypothetical protein
VLAVASDCPSDGICSFRSVGLSPPKCVRSCSSIRLPDAAVVGRVVNQCKATGAHRLLEGEKGWSKKPKLTDGV